MKTVLIIGMGKTGRHLAMRMQQLGNDVHVIDKDESRIEKLTAECDDVKICDCTNKKVVQSLDLKKYDHCFVMIGSDFQSSLVATSLLKSCGAKHVIAKARDEVQYDLLKKIGADEVVKPEEEVAERLAVCYNSNKIFDYIPVSEGYAFYEVKIRQAWVGKSLRVLDIRRKHKINIVAIKREETLYPSPDADFVFSADDHIIVLASQHEVGTLLRGR